MCTILNYCMVSISILEYGTVHLPWVIWKTQPTILVNRQIITETCTLESIYSVYSIYLLNIRQILVWTKWRWIFYGTWARTSGWSLMWIDATVKNDILIKLHILMLKTYQLKTHCKGNIHSSKTAIIILPGLVTEYRWTPLRVQLK